MDVCPTLEARAQPAHLMKPGDRALHHPALLAQSRAVGRATPGDARADVLRTQPAPVGLGVVGAVGQQRLGPPARPAALAAHRWHRLHERAQLRAVVPVGPRDVCRQRHALSVGQQVVLAASLAPVHRAWSRFLASVE